MVYLIENESDNLKQYKGSLKACLIFAVFGGFILYVLSYFLGLVLSIGIVSMIAEHICYMLNLNPYNPWLEVFLCMVICMGIGLLFRGHVAVSDDEIRVYGLLKVKRFPLKDFDHIEAKQIKMYIKPVFVNVWICHLYYRKGASLKRYRLHGFDRRKADELKNGIRIKSTEQMRTEAKIEVSESVNRGFSEDWYSSGTEFSLNHDLLFGKEASALRRGLIFYAAAAAVCLLIILLDHGLSGDNLKIGIVMEAFIIDAPVRIMLFHKRKAKCPSHIRVSSAGLIIDKKYFPYSKIDKITLKKSRASVILPAQHFVIIKADGKEKYWLGSDRSYPEYDLFCHTLQKAMVFAPEKLEYKNDRV